MKPYEILYRNRDADRGMKSLHMSCTTDEIAKQLAEAYVLTCHRKQGNVILIDPHGVEIFRHPPQKAAKP